MIPVSIVTGFLGSGKTTLISRVLRDPAFGRTAVIVNEFGEIGLDHDLIAGSDDSVVTLNTGCLCCAVQTDLARTLLDLLARRETGELVYDRVLIETSGLSDPTPILQGMIADPGVAASHACPTVVTLVDAVHGEATLREHGEARNQVAVADRILISKTDLRPLAMSLGDQIAALNAAAPRLTTIQVEPGDLFGDSDILAMSGRLTRVRREAAHAGIDTFVLVRDHPMPALALTLLLQAVAEHCGSRMLRMKGLIAIDEIPGRPAVIHGVRHVVSPPDFLPAWPSADQRTRIVFITNGVPRHFVSRLLDAIVDDVRDEMAAPRSYRPSVKGDTSPFV